MTFRSLLFAGVAIAALAIGGTLAFSPFNAPGVAQVELVAPAPAEPRQVPESEAQVKLSFAPVVRSVAPSVVNVYATRVEQQAI